MFYVTKGYIFLRIIMNIQRKENDRKEDFMDGILALNRAI